MRESRARTIAAWGLVGLMAACAALSVVPPFTMLQVQLAVLTKVASPIFLVFTLIVTPIVGMLAPRRFRIAMFAVLLVTAAVQYWPLASAHRTTEFSYSIRRALSGDANTAPITERTVEYTAADGSPLNMVLFSPPPATRHP